MSAQALALGALMIRIGFWGILYYNQNKAPTFEHWPLYYTLGKGVLGAFCTWAPACHFREGPRAALQLRAR